MKRRVIAVHSAAVVMLAGGVAASGQDDGDDDRTSAASTDSTVIPGGEVTEVATHELVSRPDLAPPVIDATTLGDPADGGMVFLAPQGGAVQPGALIVDGAGEVVWSHPSDEGETVANFRAQSYRGRPVLTWWEGRTAEEHGEGEYVVADTGYQELRRFPAGNGRAGDLHELQLTDRGTALVVAHQVEPADLTAVGGPADGRIDNGFVQEIDIATGLVVSEWNARDHIPLTDTYAEIAADRKPGDATHDDGTSEAPLDVYHLSSVADGGDGTLLVSARNTQAVYAVDRVTGEVRWTLGGKRNDFSMGGGAAFHQPLDVERLPDGTISLLDSHEVDDAADVTATVSQERALVLSVDEASRTAHLVSEAAPSGLAFTGGAPGRFPGAFRQMWTGRPVTVPDVVARPTGDAVQVEVFMSWNGATDVAQWQVLAGDDPEALAPIATVSRDGFETRATVVPVSHVAVQALDASGAVLATSNTVGVGE